MKITVLCKTEYKNCMVYVLNFHTAFQRLFIFKNEIYQNHFFFRPRIVPRILWWLKIKEYPYTPEEIKKGQEIVLNEAMESIDKLSDPAFQAGIEKRKQEEADKKRKSNPKGECVWVVRKNEETGAVAWLCMEHNLLTEYIDGQKPSHIFSVKSSINKLI